MEVGRGLIRPLDQGVELLADGIIIVMMIPTKWVRRLVRSKSTLMIVLEVNLTKLEETLEEIFHENQVEVKVTLRVSNRLQPQHKIM